MRIDESKETLEKWAQICIDMGLDGPNFSVRNETIRMVKYNVYAGYMLDKIVDLYSDITKEQIQIQIQEYNKNPSKGEPEIGFPLSKIIKVDKGQLWFSQPKSFFKPLKEHQVDKELKVLRRLGFIEFKTKMQNAGFPTIQILFNPELYMTKFFLARKLYAKELCEDNYPEIYRK